MKSAQTRCLVLFFALCLTHASCASGEDAPQANQAAWGSLERVLREIHAPQFQGKTLSILDFLPDSTASTAPKEIHNAIKQAIQACHEQGGGTVVIPEGTWETAGPVHLQSGVNLRLERGCTLAFTTNFADYLPPVLTRFEGTELMNYSPLIYALDAENVAITGEGTLDGRASHRNWWKWKDEDTDDITRLRQMAEDAIPFGQRGFGSAARVRPNFVQFYRCKNVLIEGVTLHNSPMWNIHPVLCQNVTVRGVTVDSHGPNNDGCNPESCNGVLIEDCEFDTGDDCIAIKSGRNADGRRLGVPSENIVVRRCKMRDGHGGVVLGSEMSGGIRNVFVENCEMDSPNLERAVRLKSNSLRGGFLENLFVRNVTVGEVSDAVLRINLEYWGETGEHFPQVRNIYLHNVTSKKCRRALYLVGLNERPIENVFLQDCRFDGAAEPSVIKHVEQLQLSNYSQ